MRHTLLPVAVVLLLAAAACASRQAGQMPKPGFNLYSRQQDVQIGQQAAAKVNQQYEPVQNPWLQNYINLVGQRLAQTPAAEQSGFPFRFTLLNDNQVNAFALPGGPVYVLSGLIKNTANEAELAGVLAHEMAHVVLRHGTNQVSKQTLISIPAEVAGAAAGQSALGHIVDLGLGAGLQGLFLKYSRTDESQADALGAHIMAQAGYNPIEMAAFFEKLQAGGGPGGPQFLSSHPNPGNRVKAVEAEVRAMPPRLYGYRTGEFPEAKQLVAQLPPPSRQPQSAGG